jgi:sulfoxide reductase catalytic subunit YedY
MMPPFPLARVPSVRRLRLPRIPSSEITPRAVWDDRRRFLRAAVGGAAVALVGSTAAATSRPGRLAAIPDLRPTEHGRDLKPTDYEDFTSYNNFVELGVGKEAPARNAHLLRTRPWILKVEGECEAPGEIGIDEILAQFPQEERIYRLRCVETWAAVVPWVGVPLSTVLARFKPTSKAKFVELESITDPDRLPGQRRPTLPWPYLEGLRIDEAMHPLTLLATGCYGEVLPGQNGAPLRLVVPWKYGFKSAKSIVRIRFVDQMPKTTWAALQPDEYGFYANVNPEVDHPRWSQGRERPLGDGLFARRRQTLMFNGYAAEVADLYRGMDLRRHF